MNCANCDTEIGVFHDENMLYRHRIYLTEPEELNCLIEEALCERINESDRELHIGNIKIRLLNWENFVYNKGAFKSCMNVLYKKTENKGINLPDDDLSIIWKELKKFNQKLPETSRKFKDWKKSIIINQ